MNYDESNWPFTALCILWSTRSTELQMIYSYTLLITMFSFYPNDNNKQHPRAFIYLLISNLDHATSDGHLIATTAFTNLFKGLWLSILFVLNKKISRIRRNFFSKTSHVHFFLKFKTTVFKIKMLYKFQEVGTKNPFQRCVYRITALYPPQSSL